MTEEIIIDGVDVSECVRQGETVAGITCGNGERIRLANEIITKHKLCKDNPNCYYKQLKRKEQECEELKKERDTLSVTKNKLLGDLWVAEESLKDYIEHFNKASDELDQLKGVIKKYEECNKYLVKENVKTYTRLEHKLLRTIAEIKEIAKNMNNECFYSDFDCKGCDMKNGCTYFNKKQILQKISEYEVENG